MDLVYNYKTQRVIIEQFLIENGFTCIEILSESFTWVGRDSNSPVNISKYNKLKKEELEEILQQANLEKDDFYYFLLNHSSDFARLV